MNMVRAKINMAIEALIEEKNGFVFQRLAIQCLKSKWESLMAVAEQADCGEDAVTVVAERSDGVIRSLACSLTAEYSKIAGDAAKIKSNRSDVQEIIFATPKKVTEKTQMTWITRIKNDYGMKLIIVERTEFLSILERPESQWICNQYLNLKCGYFNLLQSAKDLRDSQMYEASLKNALAAERGALDAGDWETLCRARLLLTQLHLDKGGFGEKSYAEMALQALLTARRYDLTSLLPECLLERANSIMGTNREEARELLKEAEDAVGDNLEIRKWLYLYLAELELSEFKLDKAEEALAKWEELVGDNSEVDRQFIHHMRFRLETENGNYDKALKYLDMAINQSSSEKRPINVGYMLEDKANFMARSGNIHEAALAAEEARKVFEQLDVKPDALKAALLAGHLFLESKNAERSLGLADRVLSKVNSVEYEKLYHDAIQLKTKSLQFLNRIEEALESNKLFRNSVGHRQEAFIFPDIQDAMLRAQAGEYEEAEAVIKKSLERAKETNAQKEIIEVIKVHWAQIKMAQAKYCDAKKLAEEVVESSEILPPDLKKNADIIVKIAENRAPLTSMYDDLLNHPEPLKLAGTSNRRTIQEAHKEIVRPLLEWTDIWPEALQEIYDFWGRANFRRYILNHRGFKYSYHVTVEATTVAEARLWAKVLCPLVDVLTILWKGPVLNCISKVPVSCDYKDLVGCGYAITGSIVKPKRNLDDANWFPAIGFASLLPRDAVDFLFREARGFFESGSLFLIPAPNVGCIDNGHGPIERMFNNVVNASPFLSQAGNNNQSLTFGAIPLPYFPDVPLNELATMTNGEGDSLLKTRQCLREWAIILGDRDKRETRDIMVQMHEKIKLALSEVTERFNGLAGKLKWSKQEGDINSYSADVNKFELATPVDHPAGTGQLVELSNDLHNPPWYVYFRLAAQGYNWDLLPRNQPMSENAPLPEQVYHWLVPPMPGWVIRTVKARLPIDNQ